MLEYTTPHMPQLNGAIERRFAVIKKRALLMLLNEKLNEDAQIILWAEAVQMCKLVRNSMATTDSTTRPFENLYGEKPNIIGLFSEFGCIAYITKRDKLKKHITEKIYNTIMVGYTYNNTRDTYKLYNPDTKRVIMTRGVK